jgi:hypothetical protein
MPASATVKAEHTHDSNARFNERPVLVLVEYERGSEWDDANVLCGESPENCWEPLLA